MKIQRASSPLVEELGGQEGLTQTAEAHPAGEPAHIAPPPGRLFYIGQRTGSMGLTQKSTWKPGK